MRWPWVAAWLPGILFHTTAAHYATAHETRMVLFVVLAAAACSGGVLSSGFAMQWPTRPRCGEFYVTGDCRAQPVLLPEFNGKVQPDKTPRNMTAAVLAALCAAGSVAVTRQRRRCHARQKHTVLCGAASTAGATTGRCKGVARAASGSSDDLDWNTVSTEWEVDCFSRPVLKDGKKMWELCVTDSNAVYRRVAQMKPTRVNSVVVQKILTIFIEESKVKPRVIRFYRKVMRNMLTVALTSIKDTNKYMENCKIVPSRACHMLRTWLNYREREVYPKMPGYIKTPARRASAVQASMVQLAYEPLPERLKFARYSVSAIPLGAIARMKPGQVPGKLCRIPAGFSDTAMVHGIVLLTGRAEVLCSLLKSMELCGVRVALETNELLVDLGIDTTFRIDKFSTEDKDSFVQFERAKRQMSGLHFIAVHNPYLDGAPNLPIEADDMGEEGCITGLWTCIDYAPTDNQ